MEPSFSGDMLEALEGSGVKFYLFTTSTEGNGTKLVKIQETKYDINSEYPVKILCHGWMDNKKSYWYKSTVEEYIKLGNNNVITVHWGKFARSCYGKSVNNVPNVGYMIAYLILHISENYQIPLKKFHILGHSLGSHIAGFAGKFIRENFKQKIGRITGLDPAGPSFKDRAEESRLSAEDALFVDIIHTDGGNAGCGFPIGHADFYPNSGKRKQPGVSCYNFGASHKRAPLFYAESINSQKFIAYACDSYEMMVQKNFDTSKQAIMGEHVDVNLRGIYYLVTNQRAPFANGDVSK